MYTHGDDSLYDSNQGLHDILDLILQANFHEVAGSVKTILSGGEAATALLMSIAGMATNSDNTVEDELQALVDILLMPDVNGNTCTSLTKLKAGLVTGTQVGSEDTPSSSINLGGASESGTILSSEV
ncbi:hypothetical protein NHE_0861 [Neorickettsia helminthoeca str. Oregon]|uniref:Uncharacterized protein n=1 Tax=Neorickettsia helminthoeca str. Oregon TaxID=1286528 RepID=X5H5B7_9RICK|nr:hypothetical protein [Neorickettsia helminthoeca]AHX11781.1 hypothetical protein NHE_0861 [Neorickettsia helminthoeca str. Oregon]